MDELQQRIFHKTEKIINAISFVTLITSIVAISGTLVFVFFLLDYQLNIIVIGFAVFLALLYSFIKEMIRIRGTKKNLRNFYDYLANKKVYITCYVPIFSKAGTKMILKAAALFFVDDKLFFEAIKIGRSKRMPTESITLKIGKDFIIQDYVEDSRQEIVTYNAILMDTEYQFSVINDKELIKMLETSKGDTK